MVILNRINISLYLFLIMISLGSNCKKNIIGNDDSLSISRRPLISNQLRIDGYYRFNYGNPEYASILIFYKNGIVLDGGTPLSSEIISREQQFANGQFYNFAKSDKLSWGVYTVEGNKIQFEKWYPSSGGPLKSYICSGVII